MPEVIDTNNPHTLIVRWDDHGNVCEAQFMTLRHVEIDGEVIKHEVSPVEVLDHKHLDKLDVIKATTKNALAEVNRLTSELAAAQARIAELETPPEPTDASTPPEPDES